MTTHDLQVRLAALRAEGEKLAGGLTQLAQRAAVYRHIYRASGGNHIFPLIAAHGALWARGYFQRAAGLGEWLSWQYFWSAELRQQQLAALQNFADAFRDVNRRVCAETYATFHFTAEYGKHPDAAECLSPELLTALNRIHATERARRELSTEEKQAIFTAHFLDEQEHVVGPSLEKAVADFDWPLARFIALKPVIQFAYFPAGTSFWFSDFSNRDERIERGLQAFQIAATIGFTATEAMLRKYDVLPDTFFSHPSEHFAALRAEILHA